MRQLGNDTQECAAGAVAAQPDSESRDAMAFKSALQKLGGSAGNVALRRALDWEEEKYWKIHGSLYEGGLIEKGKGKGGSVSLVSDSDLVTDQNSEDEKGAPTNTKRRDVVPELDLYEPAAQALKNSWIKERNYDDGIVEITAMMGRLDTGGAWTRPDISVVATRRFEYFPTQLFDVVTFEIKPGDQVGIKAVYEALSHQKSATMSFVLFHTSMDSFEKNGESERILKACKDHGIGLIVAEQLESFDEWSEMLPATRTASDPAEIDRFIRTFFTEADRSKIVKWQK